MPACASARHDLVGAVLGAGEDQDAARSPRSRSRRSRAAPACCAVGTKMTLCSTRSTVVATGATATSAGLRRKLSASASIAFGMVAEKNSVWRFAGSSSTIRLQRVDEAHVEHLVGLVEDEDLDLAQGQRAAGRSGRAAGPAWRRGCRRRARASARCLPIGDAAEDDRDRELQVPAVGAEALGDLARRARGSG